MDWANPVLRFKFVEREARKALVVVAESNDDLRDAITSAAMSADSPIEAKFAALFIAVRAHLLAPGNQRFALQLRPQTWIECSSGARYRLDFSLEPLDHWLCSALAAAGADLQIGVELDGHNFHERTRDQVIERDRRDRDLAASGWHILHISGSELHRNPMAAVVDVLEAGADALDQAKAALQIRP